YSNVTIDHSNDESGETQGLPFGDHETQESEGGEADLHKYLVGCKKNPGHSQFIPVNTFTLEHLPKEYQDTDLYEFIKVVADLTVRVDVKMTSSDRPIFWPKTTRSYPFYNISDTRSFRTGSGRVWLVNKFCDGFTQDEDNGSTDYTKCWCRKCEDSDSPRNVWWQFIVITATHVVFDDKEANQTTLRLFYDTDDSRVVNIDTVNINYIDIEYDRCMLNCVTCDNGLGERLSNLWKYYENVWEKLTVKYCDSTSKHKLNFIVSHPHGCSKHVSIGQWKVKIDVDGRSQFTYTSCTCPGSSGAHVQCVGHNEGSCWWFNLVHTGSLKSGLDYSGAGALW
ncbi:hypothetical protein BgiMline_022217, partial [Biomphalaria glabrata]